MLSPKLQEAINDQINKELFSEYLYLAMADYFAAQNLDGFANWMMVQTQEEHFHAMKFVNFMHDKGARVALKAIAAPQADFKSPEEIFRAGFEHEQFVTASISNLVDLAEKEKDRSVQTFLQWYVTEQIEEEANFDKLLNKVKMAGPIGPALMMLDAEAAKRVYTPPAAAGADAGTAA